MGGRIFVRPAGAAADRRRPSVPPRALQTNSTGYGVGVKFLDVKGRQMGLHLTLKLAGMSLFLGFDKDFERKLLSHIRKTVASYPPTIEFRLTEETIVIGTRRTTNTHVHLLVRYAAASTLRCAALCSTLTAALCAAHTLAQRGTHACPPTHPPATTHPPACRSLRRATNRCSTL